MAFSIGFTVGPMLGAFLRSVDLSAVWPAQLPPPHPFAAVALVSTALAAASALVLVALLPETLRLAPAPATAAAPTRRETPAVRATLDALVWRVQVVNVAFVAVFAGLEFLLAFLTAQRFAYTDRQNGQLLAFIGVVSAAVQGGYLRRLGPKTDELLVAIRGVGAMIAAHALFAFASTPAVLYTAAVLYAFASATVVSCLNASVSLMARPDAIGRVLGQMRSGGQLGRTLGPAAFAALYWAQGATVAYGAGAACGLVPLSLLIALRGPWLRQRLTLVPAPKAA